MITKEIEIVVTDEYMKLMDLFLRNDLEIPDEDEVPTDTVKCWKAIDPADYEMVGGCVLAKREGRYICDGIATDERVRGLRVGEKLLFTMLDEARSLGADELYLVSRAPGFFARYDFVSIPRDDAPTFFECFSCPQCNTTCFPEVMKRSL